ncbi:MAG: YdcF family protein [Proteobacteria bacterium]|nr:YdcF family protein [Pseudomonadota bacterium]
MYKFLLQLIFAILGLGLSLFLILWMAPGLWQWPADRLVHQDQVKAPVDAIILLMGGVAERTPHCGHLLQEGMAPKIVFVESESDELNRLGLRLPDGETSRRYLLQMGLAESSLLFDSQAAVSSTVEEITADFALIAKHMPEAKRLVLCTSWYHSSRTHWIAQKINQGRYSIESLPSPQPKSWYSKEFDFLMVFNEYLKWSYYLLHY